MIESAAPSGTRNSLVGPHLPSAGHVAFSVANVVAPFFTVAMIALPPAPLNVSLYVPPPTPFGAAMPRASVVADALTMPPGLFSTDADA